jgi:competence ComEA-like helix-hairpin-helix protein
MNLNQFIVDYLTFNRKEQRGIMVLLSILFALVAAYAVIPTVTPQKPPDYSQFDREIRLFEAEMKVQDSLGNNLNRKKVYARTGFSHSYNDSTQPGKYKPREVIVIDLNSADTFELQRLRGIGSSFAKRIVFYRERLGGFVDKAQLLEVFGMDTARFNGIKANLTVTAYPIHKINLNNVTFKDLMKHPYFSFTLTKAIILYRKDHKIFKNTGELRNVQGINDSVFAKMKNYVTVE